MFTFKRKCKRRNVRSGPYHSAIVRGGSRVARVAAGSVLLRRLAATSRDRLARHAPSIRSGQHNSRNAQGCVSSRISRRAQSIQHRGGSRVWKRFPRSLVEGSKFGKCCETTKYKQGAMKPIKHVTQKESSSNQMAIVIVVKVVVIIAFKENKIGIQVKTWLAIIRGPPRLN